MMRSLSRLHACAATVSVVILYSLYQERSIGFESAIHTAWRRSTHRLVVFGDDWSDTGTYRALPPPYPEATTRDPARGELWAETLCSELACNLIDNFAHSVSVDLDNNTVGSLIDSGVHSAAMAGEENNMSLVDLRAQVEQFLKSENNKYRIPRLRPSDDWTVFTVFFGLWDLLEYSKLEVEFAMRAIDDSIAKLFSQLDVLAAHSPTPIRVVLPQMIDITFLPRFKPNTDGPSVRSAQMQHQRLFLHNYWNAVLFQGAEQWQNGKIFMPEPNAVVMQLVRMKQLHSEGISGAFDSGKRIPLFEDVEQPCVTMLLGGNGSLQTAAVEKCADPTAHLFWDDLNLGPSTHELIGKQAARLVRGNQTVNIHGSREHYTPGTQVGESFTLKFPPNY